MMIDLERSIRTYVTLSNQEPLDNIVEGINDNQFSLVQLVKGLGEYLLNDDDTIRLRGASILAHVIKSIPQSSINRQATQTLVNFFCSKLSDHPIIVPTLDALITLSDLPTFGIGEAKLLCTSLFDSLNPKPQFPQATRYFYYRLLDNLLAKHRQALLSLGNDFLMGYIHLVQGEKDPRNLMLIFAMNRVILIDFKTESHTDAFFDVIFCYFPITFRPPPDDPYGISTDDLRVALRKCISASPFFAAQAIPLLLEKLTASSGPVKRDTLITITESLPVYGQGHTTKQVRKLWEAISIEILYSTDTETENDALKALESLIKTVYVNVGEEPTDLIDARELPGIANVMFEACYDSFTEPEKSKAGPSLKIIATAIEAVPSLLARPLTHSTLVPLLELFAVPSESSQPGPILNHVHALLNALSHVYPLNNSNKRSFETDQVITSGLKDQLISVLISSLDNKSLRGSAIAAYTQTIHINEFWNLSLNGSEISKRLIEFVVDPKEDQHVRLVAIEGLLSIGGNVLNNEVIPYLIEILPSEAPQADWSQARATVSSLASLSIEKTSCEILVDGFINKIDNISSIIINSDNKNLQLAYVNLLLSTILVVFQEKLSKSSNDISFYVSTLLPKLFKFFLGSNPQIRDVLVGEPRIVITTGKLIQSVIRSLDVNQQYEFVNAVFEALLNDNWQKLLNESSPVEIRSPLSDNATTTEKAYLPLLTSSLISIRKEVKIPLDNDEKLTEFAIKLHELSSSSTSTEIETLSAQHLVSNLVNKRLENMKGFINYIMDKWNNQIIKASSTNDEKSLYGIGWITKALVSRADNLSNQLVTNILDLIPLSSPYADLVPSLIGFIANEENAGVLDKRLSFAITRILFKQKFFDIVFPDVVKRYENAKNGEESTRYLSTLASLIQYMPKPLAMAKLPQIFPILLIALELKNPNLQASVIETITVLTLSESSIAATIQQHMSSLINSLLSFANSKSSNVTSSRLRVSSLKLLSILPHVIRKDILELYKLQVVRQLIYALDDSIKAVRKEAVDAREYWLQI